MERQSEIALSEVGQGLTILSNTSLVIAEQPDKVAVIKLLANMLHNVSKLYQIPNWNEENAAILGGWIYDNYKYDSLDDVIACLANPPQTYDEQGRLESNWRLTPDRIQKWMAVQLEKAAIQREKEHEKNKEKSNEPLEVVDYGAFKKRIEKEGLPKKSRGWEDPEYKRQRDEYMLSKMKEELKEPEPENVDKTTQPIRP